MVYMLPKMFSEYNCKYKINILGYSFNSKHL